jgi:hypothetical protein
MGGALTNSRPAATAKHKIRVYRQPTPATASIEAESLIASE